MMKPTNEKDWVAKWAMYSPEKIAVKEWDSHRSLSYQQLNDDANRLTCFFQKNFQLKRGDRIAVLAENCLEYFVLFAVAQKTGIIIVPLNYRLASAEIDFLLKDAEPQLILWEQKFKNKLFKTANFSNIPHELSVEQVFEKIKETPLEDLSEVLIEDDDPIFILYTSGTTGFPKGAIYTHKMLFWNSINTALSLIVNTESRTINVMPPFHTGGWNVLTTPFLHHGAYTCILKTFEPAVVLQLLEKEAVSIFMGVPTMLKMIADLPAFEAANFEKLLYLIVGGEAMPIPLIEKWHGKNVPVRQGYGMTEVGPNLTSLHQTDAIRKKGSIGRANFYVQTKIVNENYQEVDCNEPGELLLKGPMVTKGYWKNPTATEKAIRDGWFCTGDLVKQDQEGYLYIVDRIKNMFISGGENIYPSEIERVLIQHPLVAEVAVIGIPHPKWGEVGKAFVVKTEETLHQEEVIDYCQQYLAKFKVPKEVVFLETLPKSDTGKINRKVLK